VSDVYSADGKPDYEKVRSRVCVLACMLCGVAEVILVRVQIRDHFTKEGRISDELALRIIRDVCDGGPRCHRSLLMRIFLNAGRGHFAQGAQRVEHRGTLDWCVRARAGGVRTETHGMWYSVWRHPRTVLRFAQAVRGGRKPKDDEISVLG
jgi:hypothetical protein